MKKLKLFLSLFLLFSLFIGNVYCEGFSTQDSLGVPPSPPGGTSSGDGTAGNYSYIYTPIGHAFNCSTQILGCSPRYGIAKFELGVNWEIYDRYDNEILNNNQYSTKIEAGTPFGANLYEYKTLTWWAQGLANTLFTCQQVVTYSCSLPCWGDPKKFCTATCAKIVTFQYPGISWTAGCQEVANNAAIQNAINILKKEKQSYSMSLSDPNEMRCNDLERYGDELNNSNVSCAEELDIKTISTDKDIIRDDSKGTVTKKYYYKTDGSCLNQKTGKVRYVFDCNGDDCCNEDEMYYENNESVDKPHWHIFTPLNVKESDGYNIEFKPNSLQKKSVIECTSIVDDYKENLDFLRYIRPVNTKSYSRYGSEIVTISEAKKKIQKENGCYFHLVLNIPIKQLFYNEIENKDKGIYELNGFKIYYRQVSPSNPFPNGINDDSYWKQWDIDRENSEGVLDFGKLFNQITYSVQNINESKVRDYNSLNQLTDWRNMSIDGTSTFISNNGIINRNDGIVNTNTYYNLGCGKLNQCPYLDDDHKISNPLYMDKCSVIKEGDDCP